MWNEWGHPWPLWENGPISPEELGLSARLADGLRDWRARWEELQSATIAWTEPGSREKWEEWGDTLFDELQEETQGSATIVPCYRATEGW